MVAALGDGPAVVLRGHGVVVVGETVEAATVRALDLEALARVSLDVASAGGTPADIPAGDVAELPDLGPAFNDRLAWAHLRRADAIAHHADQEAMRP
jgi:3,4-dihydroxyphthalate decarboxylase